MKRRWNLLVWAGFAIVIAALVSYIPILATFPLTRDVPWANYLLFLAGGVASRYRDKTRISRFGALPGEDQRIDTQWD